MNILITGATGYIGGRLVPRLIAAGHHVSCLARDPNRLCGLAVEIAWPAGSVSRWGGDAAGMTQS